MTNLDLQDVAILLEQKNSDFKKEPIKGISTDSREELLGKLFVAIDGQTVDGHSFVADAEKKGALACVVKAGYKNPYVKIPLIEVTSTVSALQELAREKMARIDAKVIGVTGSVGKTTVKDFIHQILSSKYKTSKTIGNKNSQVGLATSLLNDVTEDSECVVVEMAMSESKNIEKLTDIVAPDIAVITYIALAHSCNFDSLEDIARAKAEIFSKEKTKTSIINYDSPQRELLLELARGKKVTFSTKSMQAKVKLQVEDSLMRVFDRGKEFRLPHRSFIAEHLYSNFIAAAVCAKECGMSWDEIAQTLRLLHLPEGRMELIDKGDIHFVHDAYNASEVSTKAALQYMKKRHAKGKKIAVLGSMKELGTFSENCHRQVGLAALDAVDLVICFGAECEPIVKIFKDEGRDVLWHDDFDTLLQSVKENASDGDVILLKGSRSCGLERILTVF